MAELQDNTVNARVTWRDAIAGGVATIKRVFADKLRRSALREEIAAMDRAGTLDAILDDLGLSRWEMERIVRQYPEADQLLPTMAYHLGLDLDKIEPHTLYSLRHACSLCDAHRQCRHFLAQGKSESAPFCPNTKVFETLREAAKRH
jgi:hypothetical protein